MILVAPTHHFLGVSGVADARGAGAEQGVGHVSEGPRSYAGRCCPSGGPGPTTT